MIERLHLVGRSGVLGLSRGGRQRPERQHDNTRDRDVHNCSSVLKLFIPAAYYMTTGEGTPSRCVFVITFGIGRSHQLRVRVARRLCTRNTSRALIERRYSGGFRSSPESYSQQHLPFPWSEMT